MIKRKTMLLAIVAVMTCLSVSYHFSGTAAAACYGLPYGEVYAHNKMYKVKKKYRRTSGGIGVWIVNAYNGYYIGRAQPGDLVQVIEQSCRHSSDGRNTGDEVWVYGLVKSTKFKTHVRKNDRYTLGYLKKDDLQPTAAKPVTTDAYIQEGKAELASRNSLGGSFNCADHECIGGKTVQLLDTCNLNMYYGALVDKNVLSIYDRAGRAQPGDNFDYRYTVAFYTKGHNKYAVGRHHAKYGWVFIDDRCIPSGIERLGGPRVGYAK